MKPDIWAIRCSCFASKSFDACKIRPSGSSYKRDSYIINFRVVDGNPNVIVAGRDVCGKTPHVDKWTQVVTTSEIEDLQVPLEFFSKTGDWIFIEYFKSGNYYVLDESEDSEKFYEFIKL